MIEMSIRLNLPIRAIEVTEMDERPSVGLLQEMARWAASHGGSTGELGLSLENQIEASSADLRQKTEEVQRQLESLQSQQALFAAATNELQRATKAFQQQLGGMISEFQVATVDLALAIAAKLIFEEVDSNRFPVANLVHEVVGRLDTNANAVVRLHPDDLATIKDQEAIGSSSEGQSIRFVGDSTLARGDCNAKAGEITVIYQLRRQIEEIRRELLSMVSGHAES